MYPYIFRILLLLSMSVAATGQSVVLPKSPLQHRTTGSSGQDELLSATVNWRGDIATVGNASRGTQGGQDIHFVTFDAQLNVLVKRHIGRNGDDGAAQIATLPDGRYLVAGFSEKPSGRNKISNQYFGKRDGWLLVLNEKGDTEQEIILGTADEDMFLSVAACPDGSVWVAGNSGGHAWIVRLSPSLEVLWERRLQSHLLPTHISAATLTDDGAFFVVGGTSELGRSHLWVAGFGKDGQTLMEKIYPSSQAENGTGIVSLDAQTLAIVGTVDDPRNRENGFISLLNRSGEMRKYEPLGGREYDRINTLMLLHSGQLLAAGGSASFERGSRRISAWLSLIKSDGTLDKEEYYGSKLDDEALGLLEHPDGRLFALGTTARQVLKMRQGWLFQLTPSSTQTAPLGSLLPTVHPTFKRNNGVLHAGDRVFIPFSIENTGKKGQCHLRAEIALRNTSDAAALKLPAGRSVLLPPLAAKSRLEWGLPVQFAAGTPAGHYTLDIQFFQGNIAIGTPFPLDIKVGNTAAPKLVIQTIPPENGIVIGKENFVTVEVKNEGDAAAQGLILSAVSTVDIGLSSPASLGDLPPGGKITYKLPILPAKSAVGMAVLPIELRVTDGSFTQLASVHTLLDVMADTTTVKTSPNGYTVAVWVYPNPDNFEKKELVWTQEDITIQVKVVSSQPVSRQQFCLEINGQPCQTGAKFDEVQIKGDRGSKTFSQQIRLVEGTNVLQANIQTPDGKIVSEPLNIIFSPAKSNLHIVSIGVPTGDLKYTVKDARDFAQALSSSQNKAFGKIFVDTLLSEERTTKTEILKTLRRLQYRYTDLQILPKDLLVIFVSGHGLGAYDGSFRLAASDYDGPFMEETSINFEQEVVNYLNGLPCQKLFFVDACHSGTASGTGLAGIATRKSGLNMLVSCQPEEFSYEDDNWKNGAFTRAIVQGLGYFSTQPSMLDTNTDKRLDAAELFHYIQKEVPAMVEKKRPKVSTTQKPNLFLSEKVRPLVIFE
jgi:hypothetical protein